MNERIDKRRCLLMGIKSLIKNETRSQPICSAGWDLNF